MTSVCHFLMLPTQGASGLRVLWKSTITVTCVPSDFLITTSTATCDSWGHPIRFLSQPLGIGYEIRRADTMLAIRPWVTRLATLSPIPAHTPYSKTSVSRR